MSADNNDRKNHSNGKCKSKSNDTIKEPKEEKDRELAGKAEWCPKQNIYLNGIIPDNSNNAQEYISTLLSSSTSLKIFGYGSLCWNPGTTDDTLSKTDQGVTTHLGRALGWRRCWAQKSADHRGTPTFLGLVCTLLNDKEVADIIHTTTQKLRSKSKSKSKSQSQSQSQSQLQKENQDKYPSMTEGLIYTIPAHLVRDCLEELDFREKGVRVLSFLPYLNKHHSTLRAKYNPSSHY